MLETNNIGVERIVSAMLPVCERNKWSENSVKNDIHITDEKTTPKILVEFAIVSQIGKMFCESACALEGDDPLGCSCWLVLERLDRCVSDGTCLYVARMRACDRVGELICTHRNAVRNNLNDNVNHLRLIISNKNKCISDFQ